MRDDRDGKEQIDSALVHLKPILEKKAEKMLEDHLLELLRLAAQGTEKARELPARAAEILSTRDRFLELICLFVERRKKWRDSDRK